MSHFAGTDSAEFELSSDVPYPVGWYPWYVVAILLTVTTLATIDRGAMNVLILPIQKDFGLSETEMGLLLGPAFTIFYILSGFLMGMFSDRSSRRNLLAAGILVWSIGTVLAGLSLGFKSLFAARALVGFGEACVIPAAFSIIADYFAPGRRGTALAIASLGISTGSGIALVTSGGILRFMEGFDRTAIPLVGTRQPWELVFICLGIVGLGVVMLLMTVREPLRRSSAAGSEKGAGASFATFLKSHRLPIFLIVTPYIMLSAMGYIIGAWGPTVISRHYDLSVSTTAEIKGFIILIASPTGTLLGGALGDYLTRTRKSGRALLTVLFGPILMPALAVVCFQQNVSIMMIALFFLILAASLTATVPFAVIQDIVPPQFRGRTLASFGVLQQVVGLGAGPLIVAGITDYVFRDPNKVNASMFIAQMPFWLLAMGLAIPALRYYPRMRKAAEQ